MMRNPITDRPWRGTVDWRSVGGALRMFLYSPHQTTLIPYVVYRAAADDWAPFFALLADASGSTVDTMALGMTLSVLCTEDVPRIDPRRHCRHRRPIVDGPRRDRVVDGSLPDLAAARRPRDLLAAAGSPADAGARALRRRRSRDAAALGRHDGRAFHQRPPPRRHRGPQHVVHRLCARADHDFIAQGDAQGLDASCLASIAWPAFTFGTGGTTAMIRVSSLHKRFGAKVAVSDVTFDAPDGQVTGVLGPNGAGKTTTLRLMTGSSADPGPRRDVDGVSPAQDAVAARRRLGVLPDGAGLYGRLTAREHLDYAARLAGLAPAAQREAVSPHIERFGLGPLAAGPHGFSQGEQRLVALARAMIHDPQNVLLDEPTGALDVLAARAVRQLVRRLAGSGRRRHHDAHHARGRGTVRSHRGDRAGTDAAVGHPTSFVSPTGCARSRRPSSGWSARRDGVMRALWGVLIKEPSTPRAIGVR